MNYNQNNRHGGRFSAALILFISITSCRSADEKDAVTAVPDSQQEKHIMYDYAPNATDIKFTDVSNFMKNERAAHFVAWSSTAENGQDQTSQNAPQVKIIRDGKIVLKSGNIERSKTEIDSLIRAFDVLVDSENLENENAYSQRRYELRVRYDRFDELLKALQLTHNEVLSLNTQARDMTNEYIDIELRANHERAYLETYKDLLKKATNIKDVLKIKSNIQELEEEIESKTKQMQQINNDVLLSSLKIIITQQHIEEVATVETGFMSKVGNSLGAGWNSVVNLVLWIISLWPMLLLTLVGIILIKWLFSKGKKTAST